MNSFEYCNNNTKIYVRFGWRSPLVVLLMLLKVCAAFLLWQFYFFIIINFYSILISWPIIAANNIIQASYWYTVNDLLELYFNIFFFFTVILCILLWLRSLKIRWMCLFYFSSLSVICIFVNHLYFEMLSLWNNACWIIYLFFIYICV